MYLHVTLTPKMGRAAELCETVGWLARGMERRGMRLVGAYRTTAGAPGRIIDLWEVPDANAVVAALEGAAGHPAHGEAIERLARSLEREELRLVEPASYAPAVPTEGGGPGRRLLHATLTTKYGRLPELSALVGRLREVLEAEQGWRMIGGYRTVIGDPNEVFDLWELPPERPVGAMLDAARATPAFAEAARELPAYLDAEDLLELTPTSYCP